MSKTWIAVALAAAVASPAAAQISGAALAPEVARSFADLAYNGDTGPKSDNNRVCLVRKSNGRTECRFMDEWRMIAKQIEKEEQRKR